MELEQLHSDLLALRQLYFLMQSSFSGQQNPRVEILGGRARLLFKSLLDDATAKVFMAYSKIVENSNFSDHLCSSQPENPRNGVPKPNLVFTAPPRIVPTQTRSKSTPQTAADSRLSSNPEKRKQCRACARKDSGDVSGEQDWLKRFHEEDELTRGSTENKNARDSGGWRSSETEKKSRKIENEMSSSLKSFVSCASTSHESTGYDLYCQREKKKKKKKQDSAIDDSEDISNTLKNIEAHILALKLRSRSRNHMLASELRNNSVGQLSKNKSFTKPVPAQGLSLRSDFGRSETVSRASQLHGCEPEVKRKATVGKIELLSQSSNRTSPPEFVNGFVVPSVPEDTGMKDLTRKTVRSHPPRCGSDSGRRRAEEEDPGKNMPRQMVTRPTLLDHPTTELMVSPAFIKNRTDVATKRERQMGRVLTRKKMEEDTEKSQSSSSASSSPSWTTTGSRSSSRSWTSQQSGVRSSDSRDYSSPRHYVGPVDLRRAKATPAKRRKPGSHKGSEKMIGGLRRLKNKLGLIFHHHHHHHHHHHDGEDNQLTRVDRRHSMWKHLGNLFHNAHKTRPVKKYNSKSRVKKEASEDQVGHFHALAEGFMRHVRKSGRPKPPKGKIGGLKKQKKKKKTVKKLKWWKLPNKAKKRRLKFG